MHPAVTMMARACGVAGLGCILGIVNYTGHTGHTPNALETELACEPPVRGTVATVAPDAASGLCADPRAVILDVRSAER